MNFLSRARPRQSHHHERLLFSVDVLPFFSLLSHCIADFVAMNVAVGKYLFCCYCLSGLFVVVVVINTAQKVLQAQPRPEISYHPHKAFGATSVSDGIIYH